MTSSHEVFWSRGDIASGICEVASKCLRCGVERKLMTGAELDVVACAGKIMAHGGWLESVGLEKGHELIELREPERVGRVSIGARDASAREA